MPTIRLDNEVYEALKQLAEPFVDNPNSVIRRLLEEKGVLPVGPNRANARKAMVVKAEGSEIQQFADAIGARRLRSTEFPPDLRPLLARGNYFVCGGHFIIIRISRTQNPWYGVAKKVIDYLNENKKDYFVALLRPDSRGWVYDKAQVKDNIQSGYWKLASDGYYKINEDSLRETSGFNSPGDFSKKIS